VREGAVDRVAEHGEHERPLPEAVDERRIEVSADIAEPVDVA
jgi:hypothetical protein